MKMCSPVGIRGGGSIRSPLVTDRSSVAPADRKIYQRRLKMGVVSSCMVLTLQACDDQCIT